MAIYYLIRLRAVLGLSIRALFPWSVVAVNLALSALAAIPAALLVLAGLDGFAQLVVAGLLFWPCYLSVMLVARRLDPQEIEWMRGAGGTVLALARGGPRARRTDAPD